MLSVLIVAILAAPMPDCLPDCLPDIAVAPIAKPIPLVDVVVPPVNTCPGGNCQRIEQQPIYQPRRRLFRFR